MRKKQLQIKITMFNQHVFVFCSYHQKYLLQRHPWLLQALDIDPEDLVESHVAARLNGFVGGYGKHKVIN